MDCTLKMLVATADEKSPIMEVVVDVVMGMSEVRKPDPLPMSSTNVEVDGKTALLWEKVKVDS